MQVLLSQLLALLHSCMFKDELPKEAPTPGLVRVWTPDIAGLLPVYQYDEYKGYTVKTIPNCTDEEIDR